MTTSLLIEEESGTSTGRSHPHNGYYAGDFSPYLGPGRGAGTTSIEALLQAVRS
jgi:hypothetical protein